MHTELKHGSTHRFRLGLLGIGGVEGGLAFDWLGGGRGGRGGWRVLGVAKEVVELRHSMQCNACLTAEPILCVCIDT